MKARGIPSRLVKWVDAFCSERTASVVVNGYTSEQQALVQAGLPQGSPLSPVAFLFFNADLVQRRISNKSGSIAFVDDYSAWVTGPTAESNRDGIQSIIDDALEWERRSGATFEVDKTSVIHFTRLAERDSDSPFTIRGNDVEPKENVKLLGVIMDQALRFKEHIAGVAAKGLTAAMCSTLPQSVAFLKSQGITHVIGVNSDAENEEIRSRLRQGGIDYTVLVVADLTSPTVGQLRQAYDAFRRHKTGTLVWCGYGHGRTGTAVSAIQILSETGRGSGYKFTDEDFNKNHVETETQLKTLRALQNLALGNKIDSKSTL
ncbi:hypothetical protein HIM_12345 [Hirsutella minnesotensis 3608]|uniref:Reverse transcriptase domain-containing protein n=1 Tax=Hirsutella minnesotensis 3608 TaxID=1043627 RepID=A0A0F7ZW32_9HYPO|nr:hypothetical protein HIM_12345 [Hirsutella minnesotensis 3608]